MVDVTFGGEVRLSTEIDEGLERAVIAAGYWPSSNAALQNRCLLTVYCSG